MTHIPQTRRDQWCLLLVWMGTLGLAFHSTLASGGTLVQGYIGDSRLINYLLEHGYLWCRGTPGHGALWDPPMFYPTANALAFSDLLLGGLPCYVPWRILGLAPDTSFQLWSMTVITLNYLAACLVLKHLRLSTLAVAAGAFLVAAGSPRVAQFGHEQLLPQFYPLLCVYALLRVREGAARWSVVAAVSLAAQFYTAFYTGWFFSFALLAALLAALVRRQPRQTLTRLWRAQYRTWLWSALGGVLLLVPLFQHYLAAASSVGFRTISDTWPMLPRLQSWVYLGPYSPLYRWQFLRGPFRSLHMDQEHRIGLGFVTTVLVLCGLYGERRRTAVQLVCASAAVLMITTVCLPGGYSLWGAVRYLVPGATALRAVARVGMTVLLASALGLACFVERQGERRRGLMLVLLVVVACEQVQVTPTYDKQRVRDDVAALVHVIPPTASVFVYAPTAEGTPRSSRVTYDDKSQLDAMWASLDCHIPTVNGLSGATPPGWSSCRSAMRTGGERRFRALLGLWTLDHPMPGLCVITDPIDWNWTGHSFRRWLQSCGIFL